jgi:hypothetical protein
MIERGEALAESGPQASPPRAQTTTPSSFVTPPEVVRQQRGNMRNAIQQFGYTPSRVEVEGAIDEEYGQSDADADQRASTRADAEDEATFYDDDARCVCVMFCFHGVENWPHAATLSDLQRATSCPEAVRSQ